MRQRDLVYDAALAQVLDDMSHPVGILCTGKAAEVHDQVLKAIGSTAWVILDADDLVPSEMSLALSCRHGSQLAVAVSSEQHLLDLQPVLGRIGALLVPSGDSAAQLWKKVVLARAALCSTERPSLESTVCGGILLPATEGLKGARVESIQMVEGCADRVCLDFIQMLQEGEGALVGSTAQALCFVHAETAQTSRGPARPFRISAGPVHACVALPDGRTKYLSDVSAGDRLLIMDVQSLETSASPTSRGVTVGRCHVERCPVVCIHLKFDSSVSQLFLEHSAAVRLHARRTQGTHTDTEFASFPVTELCKGDEVLVHWVSST